VLLALKMKALVACETLDSWSLSMSSERQPWSSTLVWSLDPLKLRDTIVAPPQPRPGEHPAGQDPEARSNGPGRYSNAPIRHEGQSFLSKKIAQVPE
jgi:hypothetical protein